jgi:hypothetical protein
MTLFTVFCITSILMGSFLFFFPPCLTICCVAALYFDHLTLLCGTQGKLRKMCHGSSFL